MCKTIYIYTFPSTHVHMHTPPHTAHTYTCTQTAHMYPHARTHTQHTSTHVPTHTHAHSHAHTHKQHTCRRSCTHTYVHTHMHTPYIYAFITELWLSECLYSTENLSIYEIWTHISPPSLPLMYILTNIIYQTIKLNCQYVFANSTESI